MNDWKTTITGLVAAVGGLLSHFGIVIPESWQSVILAVGLAAVAFLAKDKKPADAAGSGSSVYPR